MEVYVLVSKEKSLLIKTMTIAFLVIAVMSSLYTFFGYIVFFPIALLAWGITHFLHTRNYEYEYSYFDGELRFAKITNKKRRKDLKGYVMDEVVVIAPMEDRSIYQYLNDKSNKVKDYTTGKANAKIYVAVVKDGTGTELVKYEPDEKYINEVCIKYGYKVRK